MRLLLFIPFLYSVLQMLGHPYVAETDGPYTRYVLTDSTTMEVYETTDSVLIVLTACAPQCSSCARIYNKEGKLLSAPQSPTPSIFPLAHIENGRIIWTDNDTWNYQSTL